MFDPRGRLSILLGFLLCSYGAESATAHSDAVLTWTSLMLDAIRSETTAPTVSTRNLALLHVAIFDAANSIEGRFQAYRVSEPPGGPASAEAAATAAGREIMRVLYPSMNGPTDATYAELLANLTEGEARERGLALGRTVAVGTLISREADGSATLVPPHISSDDPGQWNRTPPDYRPALDPHWRDVRLFCLDDKEPYVAPGPPPLTSAEYAHDFEEVRIWGAADSPVRTPLQSESALFWSDFSYTAMPPGHWHEIAVTIASKQQQNLLDNARLMALMSLAQADAAIVCWEGKYRHNFWRPITAIQRAAEDGNEATEVDPSWNHFLEAPNFPEYPSGHSTFSRAGAEVLMRFYGTDAMSFTVTSDTLPGVTRTYHSLVACADEVGLSRIYGGIHFEFANRDGKESGRKVGATVSANYLLPVAELPALTIEGLNGEERVLRLHGLLGKNYTLQATDDFQTWSNVCSVLGTPGGVVCRDTEAGTFARRFYRIQEGP